MGSEVPFPSFLILSCGAHENKEQNVKSLTKILMTINGK